MKRKRNLPLSFAELELLEKPTYQQLRDTLNDYAHCGAAILADVVLKIAKRIRLNRWQKTILRSLARKGERVHYRMNEPKEAMQFARVVQCL